MRQSAQEAFTAAMKSGDAGLQRQAARRLILFDRHATAAYQRLGMVKHNGVWMTVAERRQAQGMVRYRGEWMTWQERAKRQELALARAAEARERAADRRAARAAATAPTYSSVNYGYRTYAPVWAYRPWYGYRRARAVNRYRYSTSRGRVVVRGRSGGGSWAGGFRW